MVEQMLPAMAEELSKMLGETWGYWLICVICLIAVTIFRSPWFIGLVGERAVRTGLRKRLGEQEYCALHDVTLQIQDKTTQIDHLVFSQYGVFVVETKNMKGWIYGGPRQRTWTQKIYRRNHKFQNPLFQNYGHVKAVSEVLGLDEDHIHSVVVFVGASTFKTEMPNNVVKGGRRMAQYIKSFKEPVFSADEVSKLVLTIVEKRLPPTLKTHREHVKNVRGRKAMQQK